MKRLLVIFTGVLLLSGCFVIRQDFVLPINPMIDQGRQWLSGNDYRMNGEKIYFTSVNIRGQRIRYSGGPNIRGMMMGMGANLTCASCHGSDGKGGLHTMHMEVMDASDIRIAALGSEVDDHGDDGHGDDHSEYDLEAFRLAVVEGKHPNGDDLSRDMPRWLMDDEDLADLFEYLNSLH